MVILDGLAPGVIWVGAQVAAGASLVRGDGEASGVVVVEAHITAGAGLVLRDVLVVAGSQVGAGADFWF